MKDREKKIAPEEYIERLEKLQTSVDWIVKYMLNANRPLYPPVFIPDQLNPQEITCPKCNMVFKGNSGYYCPEMDCPMFTKSTF